MMKKIFTKEQFLIYNEAAVHWNQSALGILTKALFSPLSWLKGSIKKGIKKQQIEGLISQWEVEYIKAIQKVDTGKSEPEQGKELEVTDNLSIQELEIKKQELEKELVTSSDEEEKDELQKEITKIEQQIANTEADDKPSIDDENLTDEEKYKQYTEEINILSKDKPELIARIKNKKQQLDKSVKSKKPIIQKEIYKLEFDLKDIIKKIKELENKRNSLNINESSINEADVLGAIKGKVNNTVKSANDAMISKMFPEKMMAQAKSINNIKELTFKSLNFIRLNAIKYEANYIVENSKGKENKDQGPALKKQFDLGIFNINDYFQDVIDTDLVNKKVTGKVDQQIANTIIGEQNTLNEILKMGLSEVFPIGAKFDTKKYYAFQGVFTGQNGKSIKHIVIMSPTSDFKMQINDETFFIFRLYGSYKFDKKINKNIRINLFKELTNNSVIINNFKNETEAYYLALKGLQPGSNAEVYVYSNKGSYFFDNDTVKDVDNKSNEIKDFIKDSKSKEEIIKKLGPVSNIFRFKINQRFTIEDNEINNNRFPGLDLKRATQDPGVDNAKSNHEKIIKIISI